ncbi:hypothetical protein [Rhizobium sp. P40RR-XXII]|uniref:hypothetical protein n=1 Tax=Rhizobium sp. P40RR-XXII TaxID=2726739 RepID=UPI001FEE5DA4|nr:hypothetical protein [Rhizobium sp. P40RR-XXII]
MGGEQSSADCGISTAAQVRETLSYLMPGLEPFWALPLKDYARAVYHIESARGGCSHRDEAMARFKKLVKRTALRSGADRESAENASRQIAASPVIQTGPHCHLLIEPDAFYTHLFSILGLSAYACRWHVCYSASTVKFVESAKKGPGWLRLDGDSVNVFGLSRSQMDPYSICGFNGPYRFLLSDQKGGGPANAAAARLKAILPDAEFPSAAEAIKAANQFLWQRAFPPSIRLLQFDDIDVADLVAEHFEDAASWLSTRLTGDGLFAERLLQTLDQLNAGPWAGWIRQTTDFFWGLAEGRIFPLRLNNGVLTSRSSPAFNVRFDPQTLAASLRQRQLVPNLLIAFLVISILPGIRVLGGCRQVVYYPLMRYLIASALERSDDHHLFDVLSADVRPGVWGHRVLRPDEGYPFLEFERSGNMSDLAARYGCCSLNKASGNLESFSGDPIWADLSAHVRARAIHSASPELRWA